MTEPARTAPDDAEPPPAESDEETPHESATLLGTVSSVWSSILSTAYHRLGKGR
ncbi:hypothetical protein [Streptomyces flaveolus]|uniref:hypothetical protein n=1 Tax=Streptomyces flaveolus TaxID=67297 RepID=UPI0037008450